MDVNKLAMLKLLNFSPHAILFIRFHGWPSKCDEPFCYPIWLQM